MSFKNRNVINSKEIAFIKKKIMENILCLTPLLSDVNGINIDELEATALKLTKEDIKIISVLKDIRNYRRKDYRIKLNINNLLNNAENWFTYDKYLDVFEDSDVYIDNYT